MQENENRKEPLLKRGLSRNGNEYGLMITTEADEKIDKVRLPSIDNQKKGNTYLQVFKS